MPAGYLVDAGPNWIHGTSDNPILEIAKKTNTAIGTWDSTTSVFDDAGNALSQTEAEVYSTIMWEIVEAAFRHSNQHSASLKTDESLWDFFQIEVVKRIPNTKPDYQRKREMVFQIAESWGAFVGSHIFSQSLKYFWLEECIEGGELTHAKEHLGTATNTEQRISSVQALTRRSLRPSQRLLSLALKSS